MMAYRHAQYHTLVRLGKLSTACRADRRLRLPGWAVVEGDDREERVQAMFHFVQGAIRHHQSNKPHEGGDSATTHPRICHKPWCLHVHHPLDELYATHLDARRRRIHPPQNVGLYGRHFLPRNTIANIVDTGKHAANEKLSLQTSIVTEQKFAHAGGSERGIARQHLTAPTEATNWGRRGSYNYHSHMLEH